MNTYAFTKTFGDTPALRMPALELAAGRVCAVIGANGSGKSTLARVLAGVLAADGNSRPLKAAATVGYMPQKSYAFRMSVRKNILLAGDDAARADELMRSLRMDALADRRATSLSGGETARMALARVLLRPCELLILDEPTASMDVEATLLAESLIRRACKETGCALLLVTHSLQQARRVADDALFLYRGELAERGPAADVLHTPEDPRTRQFLDFYGESAGEVSHAL